MFSDTPREPENGAPNVTSIPESEAWISPEEYLEAERRAVTKSQYVNGRIYAMSGASRKHNLIVGNLIVVLGTQLRSRPCEVYPSDMRVRVEETGLYTYPDVTVVCGEARLEDEHFDTLLNPTVVIEVLSPSTERDDRGWKAEHYRRLASVEEYLLVAQTEPRIDRFRRLGEWEWSLAEFRGLDAAVELTSIECALPLAEVYARVL